MSIVDSVVEPEQKNKILNDIGIKRKHRDSGFTHGISAYLESGIEDDEPESATATVAEDKKEGMREKRAQKQKERDAGKPGKKK